MDTNAPASMTNLRAAGLSVDVYIFPCAKVRFRTDVTERDYHVLVRRCCGPDDAHAFLPLLTQRVLWYYLARSRRRGTVLGLQPGQYN